MVMTFPRLRTRRCVRPCSRFSRSRSPSAANSSGGNEAMPRHQGAEGTMPCSPSEGPAEGVRLVHIPVLHEAHHASLDGLDVREAVVPQDPALQDGEPELHLVHPRGVLWCVDEREAAAMARVELGPTLLLPVVVDVEVVPDDDDLARDARADGLQDLHQIPPRSLRPALSIDLAGAHVERCEERARAVAAVVELLPARAAGLRRLEPRPTLMCEEALLVDAEDGRVVGRRHVQLAHPFDLVVELRVLAVEPHPDAMRPDVSLS